MFADTRRTFLSQVALLGAGSAFCTRDAWGALLNDPQQLTFGALEPLVARIQETAPAELQLLLIEKFELGTRLDTLVAAGTLAAARSFGGHDYTGYHCVMALPPALEMARGMAGAERALPVLKVLYRTATRIQERGGRAGEALHLALPAVEDVPREQALADLRAAYLARDLEGAERAFAALASAGSAAAFAALQSILLENLDVHRIVLAWRALETAPLVGEEHAATLLRQSLRFCIDAEADRLRRGQPEPPLRHLLPELLREHGLEHGAAGTRRASDEEVDALAAEVFAAGKDDAAALVAERLGAGFALEDVGEALSLAANRLVLHDPGRTAENASPGKPEGSVHGAWYGVHASDAARAWRNAARASTPSAAAASLIAGAHHTAGQSATMTRAPLDCGDQVDELRTEDARELLDAARAALAANDQRRACAAAERYDALGHPPAALLALLREVAIDADGALHAEKYDRTIREELADARPAFRRRHLVALARVSASESGFPAPGVAEARERLGS